MKHFLSILTVAVLCSTQFLFAKTWRVNNMDSSANFQSLDDAIAGVTAGDTLYLEGSPTMYKLSNPLTKKVAIIGPGYFLEENPNTLQSKLDARITADSYIYLLVAGISIEGVYLNNMAYIGADNITLKRCYLQAVSFTKQINTVINNTTIIQNYCNKGIDGDNIANNALICNNIFKDAYSNLNYFRNSTIENNTGYKYSSIAAFSFTNNTGCKIKNNIAKVGSYNNQCDISNNFEASTVDYITQTGATTDGKWQLSEISNLNTAGTNGSQVGAFGGSSPYVLSGLPSVPHIYEIDAPNTASAVSGLNVTIKIVTEK